MRSKNNASKVPPNENQSNGQMSGYHQNKASKVTGNSTKVRVRGGGGQSGDEEARLTDPTMKHMSNSNNATGVNVSDNNRERSNSIG